MPDDAAAPRVRITAPMMAVLERLVMATDARPAQHTSICRDTGLSSAEVHRLLGQLVDVGWVVTHSSPRQPGLEGGRRHNALTPSGYKAATTMIIARSRRRRWHRTP
jgi:hypothetical protein